MLPEYAYPLNYIEGTIDFNSHFKRRFKTNKRYIVSGGYYYSTRAYSYNWFTNFEELAPFRIGSGVRPGVTAQPESALLRDYIFENAQENFSGLNKTEVWLRADNNSTDIPANWLGKFIYLNNNKWGGLTASETTDSVITNLNATNFHGHNQTPTGYDRVSIELASDSNQFYLQSARKKKITLTSKNNLVRVIQSFQFSGNFLEQTFDSICNSDIIQYRTINGSNNGTGLTGGITKFSPLVNSIDLQNNPNLTGPLPPVPDTLNFLQLHNTGLTALQGYDFKRCQTIYWNTALLTGILKFTSVWDIRSTWTHPDGITMDFSGLVGNTRHLGFCALGGGKVKKIILPTNPGAGLCLFEFGGHVIEPLDFGTRTDAIFVKGYGWSAAQPTTFNIAGLHNYVFPLGTIIQSNYIHLINIGINTANINASVDNYLNNKGNFDTAHKILTLVGDNHGYLTNEGRPTRIQELIDMTLTHNVSMRLKYNEYKFESYLKIGAVAKGPVATDIILSLIWGPHIYDYSQGAAFFEIIQSGIPALNGTWTLISKGIDAAASNNHPYSNYYRFRRTDFDNSTLTTTTAILHTRNSNLNPV